ncbi:MAG: GAK system ATP-grasp enzyme [Pseudomonadales bacterium]|nr:GAK system ATP-grasp enzyme [Pseudomonadales bacterium]
MTKNLNIGVIGIRGAWSTESLSERLKEKGAGGTVIELSEIGYDLDRTEFYHLDHNLEEFDGFILKKMGPVYSPYLLDELELLELLERRGFSFFSRPSRIRAMISRLSCTIHLRENGIPMPPTFVTESVTDAIAWAERRLPVVLKPLYSTKASGMQLLTDPMTLRSSFEAFLATGEKIFYLQQKFDLQGEDYGLVFLAGEYIGAYARVSDGSVWHTTTSEGGKYGAFEPTPELIELADRAQKPFGLDFTCVDIAISREAGPIVFEVSAFGGYKGLFQSAGIDASDRLTDYAIARLTDCNR